MPPGVGAAVERVLKALHAGLVAVVDRGRAGEGVKHQRGELEQRRAALALGGGKAVVRAHIAVRRRLLTAEDGQQARCVVRGEEVHRAVEGGGGVVLTDGLHRVAEVLCAGRAGKVGQQRGAEGIVHQAVQTAAEQVAATLGVGDFGGAVLPHLAEKVGVGEVLLHDGADGEDKFVGQLVGDVEPPRARARAEPAADDGVLAGDDVVDITSVPLVHSGQILDAPPGVIVRGEGVEAVPRIVGGDGALRRAGRGVEAVGVEVTAFCAGVVEHAVEHDADAALFCLCAEGAEVLLVAEERVDRFVVGGIVAMVGGGLEDRVEVERGDVERGEVVELFRDAGEVAAEKVLAVVAALVGAAERRFVPALVKRAAADQTVHAARPCAVKAVGEDLVGDAAAEPVGRFDAAIVDGQLPGRYLIPALEAVLTIAALAAVRPAQAEVIPDQLRLRGGEEGAGKGGGAVLVRGGEKLGLRPAVGELVVGEQRAAGDGVPARVEGEVHRGEGRDRAKGGLAARVAGIKENGHGVAPFLPPRAAHYEKGTILSGRMAPFRSPKTARAAPLTCHCGAYSGPTAHAAQRTVCGFLLPLSIWPAPMSAQPLLRRGYGGAQRFAAPAAGLR